MIEVTDSGFTPENIADAEWLWTNLPTFPRNWSSLPTHEKALIVHTAARHRIEAAKAERDRIVAWLRADQGGRGLVDYRHCWNIAAMIERGDYEALESKP